MTQSIDTASDPTPDTQEPDWDAVSPHLDEALSHLRDTDRNAVLLRYFSNQSHRQVGDALGLSADAAKKRVDRALDKLRQYFTRKGVTVSAAALSTAITTHGVQAAAAIITLAALTGGTIAVVNQRAKSQAQAPLKAIPAAPIQAPAPVPAAEITATIRAPDETPAAGAEVVLITPKGPSVQLTEATWPKEGKVADAQGHVTFPPTPPPYLMVVRHPSGYAEIPSQVFKPEVLLKPWGRIEGVVMVGANPQPNWSVQMSRMGSAEEWDITSVRADAKTISDDQGRFVFDNVPPVDVYVSHANGKQPPPRGQILHDRKITLVQVQPGKPTTIQLGGMGRPVIGRLPPTATDDPNLKLVWQNDRNRRQVSGRFSRRDLPQPPHDPKLSPEEQSRRYFEWSKTTPEGLYRRRFGWNEEFDINPDGTFRIDDVLPGKYQAYFDYSVRENGQWLPSIITAFVEFEINQIPGGRSDEPLDLGLIKVAVRPRLHIGKPAPDFAAKTLDGQPLRLSEHKGKFVILKLWHNWHRLEEVGPPMKKVGEVIKDDSRFVVLNISFADTNDAYKKSLVEAGVPGIHAAAAHDQFPQPYTANPFDLCLIDEQGNVVKRDIRLENAQREIAQFRLERL
jgi:hypothetical protein